MRGDFCMNKRKIALPKPVIVLAIICVVIAAIIAAVYMPARIHMRSKYGADTPRYHVQYFVPSYSMYDCSYWKSVRRYPRWMCKAADREFAIVSIDGKLYDDYQLKDVNEWCLEKMQKDIDENIDCVTIASKALFKTYESDASGEYNEVYNNRVWKKSDMDEFLANNGLESVYVREDNFEKYLKDKSVLNDRKTMADNVWHYNDSNGDYYKYYHSFKKKCNEKGIYGNLYVHKFEIITEYSKSEFSEVSSYSYGFGILKIDSLPIDYDHFYNPAKNNAADLEEYLNIYPAYMIESSL